MKESKRLSAKRNQATWSRWKAGGQKGHPGSTLCKAAQPDKIVIHGVPDRCQACQRQLPFAYVGETRQVFDLPSLQFEVTEHHAMQAVCRCGHVHTGEFLEGVSAGVQYGPRAQAAMVHLNQNHAVSIQRTAALMEDFFGLPVSQATVDQCLPYVKNMRPSFLSHSQHVTLIGYEWLTCSRFF